MKILKIFLLSLSLVALAQGRPQSNAEGLEITDLCNCGRKNNKQARVNAGTDAAEGEFPWRVRFCKDNVEYNCCSGTIISARWILTSANCVDLRKQVMNITVGGVKPWPNTTRNVFASERIIVNNRFRKNEKDSKDDIALIELSRPLNFNDPNIAPICLPYKYKNNLALTGEVELSGWGWAEQEDDFPTRKLQKTKLRLMSNQECEKLNKQTHNFRFWPDQQICTAPAENGPCLGDRGSSIDYFSGGKWYIFGVASYGDSCADPSAPAVFARVPFYMKDSWFPRTTGNLKFCEA